MASQVMFAMRHGKTQVKWHAIKHHATSQHVLASRCWLAAWPPSCAPCDTRRAQKSLELEQEVLRAPITGCGACQSEFQFVAGRKQEFSLVPIVLRIAARQLATNPTSRPIKPLNLNKASNFHDKHFMSCLGQLSYFLQYLSKGKQKNLQACTKLRSIQQTKAVSHQSVKSQTNQRMMILGQFGQDIACHHGDRKRLQSEVLRGPQLGSSALCMSKQIKRRTCGGETCCPKHMCQLLSRC